MRGAHPVALVILGLSVCFNAASTSPPPAPPPAGWDKCQGEPRDLSTESIYSLAIREFERTEGRLAPDKYRIIVRANGCAWWVEIHLIPPDPRGKFGVNVDRVSGRATWRGWLDV